jgi:hypothetical protein
MLGRAQSREERQGDLESSIYILAHSGGVYRGSLRNGMKEAGGGER